MRRVATLVLFSTLIAVSAFSAVYVVPSDERFIDQTSAIVTGTVTNAYCRYTSVGEIESVFTIDVDDVLKGDLERGSIQLVEWGGIIGDTVMWTCGAPRYAIGKRYLIFLDVNNEGAWTTKDGALGRFGYEASADGFLLQRDADQIEGWDADGGEVQDRRRLATPFLEFIRNHVHGCVQAPNYFVQPKDAPQVSSQTVTPTFSDYDLLDAATVGVQKWDSDAASNVAYSISAQPASDDVRNTTDGEEKIIEEDPHGVIAGTFPSTSNVIATAYMSANTSGHDFGGRHYLTITGSDVVTQNGVRDSSLGQNKFRTAMTHELGHTLGFRHSDQNAEGTGSCSPSPTCTSSAVMNSFVNALDGVLQSWDIAAVRATYGSSGDGTQYTEKFCVDFPACTTYTVDTGRRTDTSVAFRIASIDAVCVPAAISTPPSSKSITEGQSATLTVAASGTSPFTYQWYAGTLGDDSNPVGSNSSSFNTGTLNTVGTFSYWVRVSNSCEPTGVTATATVTVNACVPASISSQPVSRVIDVGTSTTLSVGVSGTSPFAYQWYQGNKGDTSNRISTTSRPTVHPTVTTNYWVRVIGACGGSVDSNTVTVTVVSGCTPPAITAPAADQTIPLGQSATLTITATDATTITWYQGLPGDTSVSVGTGVSITVSPTVTTTYWALLVNSCAQVQSDVVTITVEQPTCTVPTIAAITPAQKVGAKVSAFLSVTATGTETKHYYWFKGAYPETSTPVGDDAPEFTTPPLLVSAQYWVHVANDCGTVDSETINIDVTPGKRRASRH